MEREEWHDRAEAVLAHTFQGTHNVPGKVKRHGWYMEVCVKTELATFDFDRMTRLVIAAHHHAVRASVSSASPQYIRIMLHPRKSTGRMYERHPSINDLIDKARLYKEVQEL